MNSYEKMREALELCYRIIHCAIVAGLINRDDANKAMDAYHAALSAPPRNCDVGTAEEQVERFARYCHTEVCKRKMCKTRPKALVIDSCALRWSQMQYAAQEGGEK